jgi:starch synthase
VRVVFLNENLGGHATVHVTIERVLRDRSDVVADFVHVPAPRLVRRLVGAPLPGLARLDLDLQPLRLQLAAANVARRLVRRRLAGADALHVYTQNAGLLSTALMRSLPTVVTVDSTNALNAFRLPYREPTRFTQRTLPITQAFERRVYDAADVIVSNNRAAYASLVEDYGLSEDKLRYFPLGTVVPASIPQAPARAVPRITFVGASLERKGGRFLLEVHQRHLWNRCVLTLVTREQVSTALRNVEVVHDVTPSNGRLAPILASTDVFVFPTLIDQSPNVVLEAMAYGLPVVASPVGDIPEMVEDGVTGVLVPPQDEAALLRSIVSLLDDPATARSMGERGRRAVLERYDASLTTARLIDVIKEAVCRRRQRPAGA